MTTNNQMKETVKGMTISKNETKDTGFAGWLQFLVSSITQNKDDETFDDPGTSANEHEAEAVKDRRFTEYLQYRR